MLSNGRACAMRTKSLDYKIYTFKFILSWRFPRNTAFLEDFPLCPQMQGDQDASFCRKMSGREVTGRYISIRLSSTELYDPWISGPHPRVLNSSTGWGSEGRERDLIKASFRVFFLKGQIRLIFLLRVHRRSFLTIGANLGRCNSPNPWLKSVQRGFGKTRFPCHAQVGKTQLSMPCGVSS